MDVKSTLAALLTALFVFEPFARAEEGSSEEILSESERPHTMAVAEAGIILLPTAPIAVSQRGGRTPFGTVGRGDATIMTGLHLLFRASPEWAFGVGASFGPSGTSDTEYGGEQGLPRTHSRSYLVLGGEVRYIPLHSRSFDLWVGMSTGAVVIADRFLTDTGDDVPQVLGQRDVTLRTEGFSLGVQAGTTWNFAERWSLGLSFRGNRWFLPGEPRCSAIGDCTTLSGSVEAFEMGLALGYRIPL